MTRAEAIAARDVALAGLGLVCPYGDPITGVRAAAFVGDFHGDAWDQLHELFLVQEAITSDAFLERATGMIRAFAENLFEWQCERKLALNAEAVSHGS